MLTAPPMVRQEVARQVARGYGYERDDMVAAGMLGMVEASKRFQEGRGATMDTYCRYRVVGAILDGRHKARWFWRRRGESPERTRRDLAREPAREVPVETRIDVARLLGQLPERESMVLALVYLAGWTQVEVGRLMGLSRSWVCRLEARALRMCREVAKGDARR